MSTDSPTPERVTGCAANICEPHHFVWTWPIEGGSGSIGVCSLCGLVTTGERDAAREQALREAYDVAAGEWANDYADWMANNPGPSGIPSDPPMLDTYIARGGAR